MRNLVPEPWRITVADDGSGNPAEITYRLRTAPIPKYDTLSRNGVAIQTCDLELQGASEDPFLDPLENPLLSAVGNKVTIEWWKNGAYRLHRTLFVTGHDYDDGFRPANPSGQSRNEPSTLSLSLGCEFALKQVRHPPQDDSKIELGQTLPLETVLNNWLLVFFGKTIASLPGDFDLGGINAIFSFPYSGGEDIVSHIGAILASHADAVFWQDPQERIRIRSAVLDPATSDFVISPYDCPLWNRVRGEKEPVAGLVRVLGVSTLVQPYTDPPDSIVSSSRGNYTDTTTISEDTTPLSRTITKTSNTTLNGIGGFAGGSGGTTSGGSVGVTGTTEEVTYEQYGGEIGDRPHPEFPALLPPIKGVDAHLQFSETVVRGTPDGTGSSVGSGLVDLSSVAKYYTYRYPYALANGIPYQGVEVASVTTVTSKAPESGFTGGGSGGSVGTGEAVSVIREYWVKDESCGGNARYRHYTEDLSAGNEVGRVPEVDNQPPPGVQFAPPEFVRCKHEFVGECEFIYPIGAQQNDTLRDFNYRFFLPSQNRAKELACREGALLIARYSAQEIGFVPPLAWVEDPHPLPIFERSDNGRLYMLDAVAAQMGDRASYLAGRGLYLGTRIGGNVIPPYEMVLPLLCFGEEQLEFDSEILTFG